MIIRHVVREKLSKSILQKAQHKKGHSELSKKGGKERHQGEASASSKMVILDVTHHHFCHVLLVTQILRQCRRRVNTGGRPLRSLAITGTIFFYYFFKLEDTYFTML